MWKAMSILRGSQGQSFEREKTLAGVALLLGSAKFSLLAAAQKLPDPIIVNIKEEPKSELNGLADVLIGSLGIAGIMIVLSVLAALVFAGVLFWIRSRAD